mmetsp:Transcript_75648/g.202512  ORF Transcript_75648/g.202512 Transcript_75648/m.202512 type:complete len:87 (+) Transcript_75648:86-346(+)
MRRVIGLPGSCFLVGCGSDDLADGMRSALSSSLLGLLPLVLTSDRFPSSLPDRYLNVDLDLETSGLFDCLIIGRILFGPLEGVGGF